MTDGDVRRYIEHVRGIGDCFLHVYPSSATALSRALKRMQWSAPRNVRGIIAESEIVYDDQRRLAEEVFGCRYFACYGHTEKVVLAAECEHSSDYHVWPTYGCFELLDEQGQPVTRPGQRGEIVGTGFINTVVPFIRYRTGDTATYLGERCAACGREQPMITEIRGHRTQEMLIAGDGSDICWTALNLHDDTFLHVRRFQFYQEAPGRAELRVVAADGFSEGDLAYIERSLRARLGGRVEFSVRLVDEIVQTSRAKAIYVDQRIARSGAQSRVPF
jgi:phenylacetate-CoA ligase